MSLKKIFLIFYVFSLAGLFLLPGCHSSKVTIPSGILPEKKMQAVMLDVLTAEGYAALHNTGLDSSRKSTAKLYSEIFTKHNITKEEYTRSYDFYARHPELFEKNIDPVIDSLNAMEARTPVYIRPKNIAADTIKPGLIDPLRIGPGKRDIPLQLQQPK